MATFTNQATLSYTGGVVNSNIVTGELLEALNVTKNALNSTYTTNDRITYSVSITNSSNTAYTALTLTDDLGAYALGTGTAIPLTFEEGALQFFVNGVLQSDPTVTVDNGLIVSGINIPAMSNALLLYSVTVNGAAPPASGNTVTNTVTLTGNGIVTPITAQETVTAEAQPRLAITKAISPAVVSPNQPLTYTFTVSNLGNTAADAADGIVITDTFDPIIDITSVTYNGIALVEGQDYTYNQATGEFATTQGYITVPAASFVQDPVTGEFTVVPAMGTLEITGTV